MQTERSRSGCLWQSGVAPNKEAPPVSRRAFVKLLEIIGHIQVKASVLNPLIAVRK